MILLHLGIIFMVIFCLLIVVIGWLLGSSKTYELPQKTKKGKRKAKEKKVKEKAPAVNLEVVEALQSLGFKKQEATGAAQAAVEELGNEETGVLIKEALRHI